MGVLKSIIILSVVVLFIFENVAAEIKPKEYESSSGGGKCDTDLECSNQGRCLRSDEDKPDDAGQEEDDEIAGKCYCFEGRDGKNCEKKETSSRRGSISRKIGTKEASKRELAFPGDLEATGLDPKDLEKNDQEFLFYSPRIERYWKVSPKSPKTGKESKNNFLVAEHDYRGAGKLFKLKKAGADEFNIITMDDEGEKETGFVYVSEKTMGFRKKSQRVMRSSAKEDTAAYKFKFKEHPVQNGVYKILSSGQTLYSSIGGHNIKADKRADREKSEEIWFQLNLKADKNIKTEVTETKSNILAHDAGIKFHNEDFDNGNTEDQTVVLDKEKTKSRMITELEKTGITATGGLKAKMVNVGISATKESSTTKQGGVTLVDKANITLLVKGKTKLCVEYTYKDLRTFDEKKIKVSFKAKEYIGYKLQLVSSGGDFSMKTTVKKNGEKC